MHTPSTIFRHPIHPMLIVFPVGLLIFSLVCDLIYRAQGSATDSALPVVALYTMIGGVIGALVAAVPGFIDLLAITDRKVKKIALAHMTINLIAVTLYAINIYLRLSDSPTSTASFLLSLIGVVMLAISGWLGGEMVHVHGVGVELDASSRTAAATRSEAYSETVHGHH